MKKLSIVVPVYCNENSLHPLLSKIEELEIKLSEKNIELELIFVDDGSYDRSFEVLLELKARRTDIVKIIKLTRNFGAVRASKTGAKYITGDCFTILAADLQDPPELILEMIDHWLNGAKYVICTRNTREDPWLTKIFAKVYYKAVRLMVTSHYPNTGFDIYLMDKTVASYLAASGKNIYTPIYTYLLGFKPTILSYDRPKRIHGKSKWTFRKKIVTFWDAILGSSVVPIRAISIIGMIISFFSLAYGVLIVFNTLSGKTALPGFPAIITLNAFLLGLIIIMLGVIGEYVWRIFDQVNNCPETVVDEIY